MAIPAGPKLIRRIVLAYRSNVPVMLHGLHGVGKSEILAQASEKLDVGLLVRDLSLMEPPDLVGIPEVDGGRTHFRPPACLPTTGSGLLVFEELNRCPRYMQAPTFQLLTARELNDYVLPDGWLPVAAVNDATDGYSVDDLDPALMSRFAHIRVVADARSWCSWASGAGVHPAVIAFVGQAPKVFEKPTSNPRSWTYASRVLNAWESSPDRQEDDLVTLLAGLLDESWAHAFLKVYQTRPRVPAASEIANDYRAWRRKVRAWVRAGRLDMVTATWLSLKAGLSEASFRQDVVSDPMCIGNVEQFIEDMHAELRTEAGEWLSTEGITGRKPKRRGGRR